MDKEYAVIRPFIDETGYLWTVPQTLNPHEIAIKMVKPLLDHGYIEETALHKLIVWAKGVGWSWDRSLNRFTAEVGENDGGPLTGMAGIDSMKVFYNHFVNEIEKDK